MKTPPRYIQVAYYLKRFSGEYIPIVNLAAQFSTTSKLILSDIAYLEKKGVRFLTRKYRTGNVWRKEIMLASDIPHFETNHIKPDDKNHAWQELLRRKKPFLNH